MTIDQAAVTAPPVEAPATPPSADPVVPPVETPVEGAPTEPTEPDPFANADAKLKAENHGLRTRLRQEQALFEGVAPEARESIGELLGLVRAGNAAQVVEYLLDLAEVTAGPQFTEVVARRGQRPAGPASAPGQVPGAADPRSPLSADDAPLTRAELAKFFADQEAERTREAQVVQVNAGLIEVGLQPGSPQANMVLVHMLHRLENDGVDISAGQALEEIRRQFGAVGAPPALPNSTAPAGGVPAGSGMEGLSSAERAKVRLSSFRNPVG